MKFDFTYGTPCVVTVIDTYDNSWEFGTVFHKVQDAFNVAEDIFNGYTAWNPSTVDVIFITDTETGEILVECTHDEPPNVKYDNDGNTICPHEFDDVDCKDCEIQKSCNL